MWVVKRNRFDEPYASVVSDRPSEWRVKRSTFCIFFKMFDQHLFIWFLGYYILPSFKRIRPRILPFHNNKT
jgi:hypothetical protein